MSTPSAATPSSPANASGPCSIQSRSAEREARRKKAEEDAFAAHPFQHGKWYLGYLNSSDASEVRRSLGCIPWEPESDVIEFRYTRGRMDVGMGICRHGIIQDNALTTSGWHEDEQHFTKLREATEEEVFERIRSRYERWARLNRFRKAEELLAEFLPEAVAALRENHPALSCHA